MSKSTNQRRLNVYFTQNAEAAILSPIVYIGRSAAYLRRFADSVVDIIAIITIKLYCYRYRGGRRAMVVITVTKLWSRLRRTSSSCERMLNEPECGGVRARTTDRVVRRPPVLPYPLATTALRGAWRDADAPGGGGGDHFFFYDPSTVARRTLPRQRSVALSDRDRRLPNAHRRVIVRSVTPRCVFVLVRTACARFFAVLLEASRVGFG